MNYFVKIKYYIVLMLVMLIWASAFVGIRYAAGEYMPGPMALLRFIVASLVMLIAYFFYENKQSVKLSQLLMMLGIGVLGIAIYNVALNQGERVVSAGVSGFIVVGQMPVVVSLLAVFFLKERIRLLGILGFFISLFGLCLMVMSEQETGALEMGVPYLLIAVLSGSIQTICQKNFLKKFSAIEVVSYAIWGGTLALLILYLPDLISEMRVASFSATQSVIYMGVFPGAISHLLFVYSLKHLHASKASSFLYLVPFFTLFLAWWWLREIPTVMAFVGGVAAIFGAYIINKNSGQRCKGDKK
jgi:drug/metabolite transporter (DMT)-like permease